jgi:predicted GIY-YIG superfamily endonuclease
MNLYILKCKNNKYYVGTTKQDVKKRLTQHMKGWGAAWTKKYKPISKNTKNKSL